MANFLQKLFGWSGTTPPKDKPRKGEEGLEGSQFDPNPYTQYQNSVKAPLDRRKRYDLYDDMDEMSDISSVLDAYAEDCTQTDREKKTTLWIESKNASVRRILEDVIDRLSLEDLIEAIHRDTGKYGDDFAQLLIENDSVEAIDWKDPREVERIETRDGILAGFEKTERLQEVTSLIQKEEKVKFTFQPWDIVHFRLYRRKRDKFQKFRNIYGTSILANSERIAKQVKILDDLLMVRRLTKSLDYRVYEIDTGRSSVEEEILILKRWRNALKRKPYIDPINARFDSNFDPWTFQEDLFWPKSKDSASHVEVIQGQPNVADIVDIEMFRDKLYGSLRAPKAYFGFEGEINAKATLGSQDIKWGRTANSLQRAVKNGLSRLFQIQLALKGIDPKIPANSFTIGMVVPSVLEDLSRLEAVQTTIDIAERMASLGETLHLNSDKWRGHILRTVLGMTDDEVEKFSDSHESPDDPDEPEAESDITALDEVLKTAILSRMRRTTLQVPVTENVFSEEIPLLSREHKLHEAASLMDILNPVK